jgi:hypothetical protein
VRHPSYLAALRHFRTSGTALGSSLAAAWGVLFIPLVLWVARLLQTVEGNRIQAARQAVVGHQRVIAP